MGFKTRAAHRRDYQRVESNDTRLAAGKALVRVAVAAAVTVPSDWSITDFGRRLEAITSRVADDTERLAAASAHAAAAADHWLETTRGALVEATELRGDGLDAAMAAAAEWVDDPVGENPVGRWAAATSVAVQGALADERGAAASAAERLSDVLRELAVQISELEEGRVVRPPVPYTRPAARDRPGAPLWECVDPVEGLDAGSAAGLEAALEAAGLLDAWVRPDGSLENPVGDTLLVPAVVEDAPTLLEALVPTPPPGAGLEVGAVEAVLGSIALAGGSANGAVRVDTDGTFALGPLIGSWSKPSAQYLGATAREQARRRRLDDLREERGRLDRERAGLLATVQRLTDRLARLAAEVRGLPADTAVRASVARVADVAARRSALLEDELAAREIADGSAAAAAAAAAAVAEAAGTYDLDPANLAQVMAAIREARAVLQRAIRESRAVTESRQRGAERAAELIEVESDRRARQDALAVARAAATRASATFAALDATVGVEIRRLEQQLVEVDAALVAAKRHLELDRGERETAVVALAVAEDRLLEARAAAEEAGARREDSTGAFRDFAGTGLIPLAAPGLEVPDATAEWLPDPTVRLARRIAEQLADVDTDDATWDRAVARLLGAFETVQLTLSAQGRQALREVRHGVAVVTIQHGAEFVAPDVLALELEEELADRERLLTEQERAILQTHLIDEVGAELQARVQAATLQVARMNQELDRRPTRSGLKLRIVWQPDDGDLERARRDLLRRAAAAWSVADREAIGAFLTDRIEQSRRDDETGTWHERLGRAFDYRAWNRFSVQIHQNGSWRPASGPASGGERVLAASVPLFAAASSHYSSAGNPNAPRLILLDEAFAGVDDRSRASYLGLLAEFDLDVMMTSEREWATYPEVPGIAIAQLFRLPDAKAVHVDHWEWDGAERRQVEDPGATAVDARADPPERSGSDPIAFDFDDAVS